MPLSTMEAQGLHLPNFPYTHDTQDSPTGLDGDPEGITAPLAVKEIVGTVS